MQDQKIRGAVILAGGDSSRLGCPKPLLKLGGVTLIERIVARLRPLFNRITIVTDRPELFEGLPARLTGDLLTACAKSPLRGIHAGLSASSLPYQFVVACDMPFLNGELIEYMAGFAPHYDAVVPRIGTYCQPLHAFYRRSCLDPIRRQVERGLFKITGFYAGLAIRYIEEAELAGFPADPDPFFNINTWADYEAAARMLAGSPATG